VGAGFDWVLRCTGSNRPSTPPPGWITAAGFILHVSAVATALHLEKLRRDTLIPEPFAFSFLNFSRPLNHHRWILAIDSFQNNK
jgi:hypothetical protein